MTTKINSDQSTSTTLHKVTNGLYAIRIEMREGMRGRATGVIVLYDGRIMGGDSYTGTYTFKNGKWRGELITHPHRSPWGKAA